MPQKIILHLPVALKKSVDLGKHNFFCILRKTFEDIGYDTKTKIQGGISDRMARYDKNLHIFNIDGAVGPRALNVRRAHFYPFWSLENAGTRRAPRITTKKFDPATINAVEAQVFFNQLFVRNLPNKTNAMADQGFVFVPLQGRLLTKRPWQMADTDQMIKTILQHDPNRKIIVKPHPRETYSGAEQNFISQLAGNANISVTDADTDMLLNNCAYVVTQNSGAAFQGFLYQKPAILFAKSDFFHICKTVALPQHAAAAFGAIGSFRPAFEKYIYWYLQLNCINAGRDTAPETILQMAKQCGWDI